MDYETIKIETHGRVALLRLDRPRALNALNARLIGELADALTHFEADAGIGCVVLTGSAEAFAAGADIKELRDKTVAERLSRRFPVALGRRSPAPASRSSRRSPALRSAAAASSP